MRSTGIARWTLLSCCVYVIVAVGRLGELVPGLAGIPIAKIAIASAIAGLFFVVESGGKLWSSTVVRLSTYLLALAVASVLFSVWRWNSLVVLRDSVIVLAVSFALIVRSAMEWRDVETLLKSVVVAGSVLAFMALYGYTGGRAEVTSMYDTNDLAFVLVAVLPIAVAFGSTRSGLARILYMLVAAAVAITILLTASRGGFLGLAAVAVTLAHARPRQRDHRSWARTFGIALVVGAVCVATWSVMPAETRERIETVFDLGSDYNLDAAEKNGRLAIWKRNSIAGIERPIGYGIGSFGVVDLMTGGDERAPHNTLLEAFVELGALGLALLVLLYWRTIAELVRLSPLPLAPGDRRGIFARCLMAALIGTLVSGFFLSMLKSSLVWAIFAITAAAIANLSSSQAEGHGPR